MRIDVILDPNLSPVEVKELGVLASHHAAISMLGEQLLPKLG